MGRKGVTKEQVFEMAAALQDEGIAPTVKAIQERTGGSYSTITPHLAEWRKERAGPPADIPSIPDKVQAAFQQIWATAARAAQNEVETQKQALDAMRREMASERTELTVEIARLEDVLEDASKKREDLEAALKSEQQAGQDKDERSTALQIENARLEERARGADARAVELKAQLADLQVKLTEVAKAREASVKKATPRKR